MGTLKKVTSGPVHSPNQLLILSAIASKCAKLRRTAVVAGPPGCGIGLTLDKIVQNSSADGEIGNIFIHEVAASMSPPRLWSEILNDLCHESKNQPRADNPHGLRKMVRSQLANDSIRLLIVKDCHLLSAKSLLALAGLGRNSSEANRPGMILTGDSNKSAWLESLRGTEEVKSTEYLGYLDEVEFVQALETVDLPADKVDLLKEHTPALANGSLERLASLVEDAGKLEYAELKAHLESHEVFIPHWSGRAMRQVEFFTRALPVQASPALLN